MSTTSTETSTTAETGTESPETATETTAAETSTETPADTGDGTDAVARLEAENARLRRENASDRVTAKEQAAEAARNDLLATLTKALGGETGDEAPTVEQLTADLTEQKQTTDRTAADLREARAELVVWRNATDLGVDAAAVTDSRAFERALADLDPTSKTFAEDVKKAAQAAAENNPKLKAAQAAGKSGAELNGGTGEGAISSEQFQKMSGAERNRIAQTNPTLYAQLSGRA